MTALDGAVLCEDQAPFPLSGSGWRDLVLRERIRVETSDDV
jgi:hypothetical protein